MRVFLVNADHRARIIVVGCCSDATAAAAAGARRLGSTYLRQRVGYFPLERFEFVQVFDVAHEKVFDGCETIIALVRVLFHFVLVLCYRIVVREQLADGYQAVGLLR